MALEELFWGGRNPSDIVLPNPPLRTSLKQHDGSVHLHHGPLTMRDPSVLAPSCLRRAKCKKLQSEDLQPVTPTKPTGGMAASLVGVHAGSNIS